MLVTLSSLKIRRNEHFSQLTPSFLSPGLCPGIGESSLGQECLKTGSAWIIPGDFLILEAQRLRRGFLGKELPGAFDYVLDWRENGG
jgi:hypothetical protein